MLFSSSVFLFLFLPGVLLGVLLLPTAMRNPFLLAASLIFYAWGETVYTAIILVSVTGNYILANLMAAIGERRRQKAVLITAVVLNLGLLGWFKYANFLVDTINDLLKAFGMSPIELAAVHLPLGISFFTFQALSYVIDVYQGKIKPQKRFVDLALYITLFPQLVAGPIVRYRHIAGEIMHPSLNLHQFSYGTRRFIIGLAKKMIIANPLGEVADSIFALPPGEWSLPIAWLGTACFAIQLYFDFAGYSDMAIGLGRMFGFTFRENFNFPYIATSFREFWQRWHISLSLWFRDYLYIPLGGNRCNRLRTQLNLWAVFILVGLWHGASWNFVVFGALHGFLMVLERAGLDRLLQKLWRPLRHVYFLGLCLMGWGVFCTRNIVEAGIYTATMLGLTSVPSGAYSLDLIILQFFPIDKQIIFVTGCLLAVPWKGVITASGNFIRSRLPASVGDAMVLMNPGLALGGQAMRGFMLLGLLALSIMHIAAGTYNPFIYFRF